MHVTAAVIWVGGDITLTTLGIVFERRQDGETLAALGKMGAWIGVKVYTPALFVVLAFGLAMMHEGNLDFGQFWIIFALVGWTIATVVGSDSSVRSWTDRRGGSDATAHLTRGRRPRQAPLHDLPLRHDPADPDRDQHGREAVLLGHVRLGTLA